MARFHTSGRPIRNHPGAYNIIGLFWSILLQRHVVTESLVERLLFLFLEWLRVDTYVEQPHSNNFNLTVDGRTVKYTPDALAAIGSRRVLYQAKPQELAEIQEFLEKMDTYGLQLAAQGYEHQVFSPETWPNADVFWMNLLMLYGYAKRHSDPAEQMDAVLTVKEGGAKTLGEAVACMRARGRHVGSLYAAIFYKRIEFDVHEKLTAKAPIGSR